ncbi:MAG: hypothetical protein SCH71_09310 [Desulfobulbaceae bacterium]|nr:hypothetical protein [Desulfobulbaceae bacterium]
MNKRAALLQGALLLLLLLAGMSHLKTAFLAQLATNNSANAIFFSRELTDPETLGRLARKEHLVNADLVRALDLYQRALGNFILHVPSWLGLAEVYNDMGRKDQAVAALTFIQDFSADNEETAWSQAILANELDQVELMTSRLVWLAANYPARHLMIFTLADLHWPDPAVMMEKFDRTLYPAILEYYIDINDARKAGYAWKQVVDSGTRSRETALRYVNYLLKHDETEQAALIWQRDYREDNELLFNRDLQLPFMGSGFGWRINRADGVDWRQLENGNGLQIEFDGSENPSLRLAQIVPLSPGRYIFSGDVESLDLTTDQRPYWSITGYNCKGLNVKSEMIPSTSPHDTLALNFTVPDGCHAVQIALRRNPSYFFDNLMSGLLKIDGLALEPDREEGHFEAVLPGETPDRKTIKAKTGTSGSNIEIKRIQVY